ncbi:MarR family transcriptional regulator [Thauera sp.]|uniref:MarR family winged helix-turn-helix transcriptional regulator n=1 Tax=Thauera sp. TaxID=1905334 RepID=UPI001B41234F|nr:MarR family transcriptional regulator [Thauera sp.]HMV55280.1 MarR family transcriptional regulator [Rhodocyclaceae bacterium]HNB05499.1 MarR family transcriptional regulator [Thauera aminoaromatica]MBP6133221.1 MarR family transcriptional regulator [Thauera sp.]MBP7048612.1 MarR family transcriptional regulator [Thauera sp.]MBX3682013.1 MarR family transcriptional regulator [Thauera sp.]
MGGGNDNLAVPTSTEAITFGMLPELIGYRLRIAQIGIFRDFCTSVDEAEITPTLFGVLVLIDANPGMKQTQLADAIQLDRSSVVSVLDKLEARGLVERVRAPDNRRANALHLTAAGRHLLHSLIPQVRAHEERVLQDLDAAERAQLRKLLGRLVLAAG